MNKKLLLLILSFFTLNFTFAQEEIIEIAEEPQVQTFYVIAEEMPVFSEDCLAFEGEYLTRCTNLKIQEYMTKVNYPQLALDDDLEGKVYVGFIVDYDGSVTDVTLERGAYKLLDDAAIEHVKNMPDFFKPGYENGKEVRIKYIIPIVFRLYGGGSYNIPLTKKEQKQLLKYNKKRLRALKKQ